MTLPNVITLDETGLTYAVVSLHTAGNEATIKLIEINEWNERRRSRGLPEVTLPELHP